MQITNITSKRVLAVFLSVAMVFSLLQGNIFTASAETNGDFQYVLVGDNKAKITAYTGTSSELTIPSKIGDYTVTQIGERAFYINETLTSVTIPDTVTKIDDVAFAYCYQLTKVVLPNILISIGSEAFRSCRKLEDITIPSSVNSIDSYAFEDCTSLKNITVDAENKEYSSKDGVLFNKDKTELIQYPIGRVDTTYTVPNSVKDVSYNAFNYCTTLKSVMIPSSVTSVSGYAFDGCTSLTSITVDSKNTNFSSENGVLFNKNKTEIVRYPAGITATTYTIPSGVTKIDACAFSYCESLDSVIIPKGVASIGNMAFIMCTSLKSITLPNSISKIDSYAFTECTSLKNVNYLGSKEQWKKLTVDDGNEDLMKASVSYCKHTSTTVNNKKAATYFAEGYTGDTVCKSCGTVVKKGKATAKKTLKKPSVKVTPGKKQFKVKYNKVSGATGFEVQYKIGKKTVTKAFSTKKSVRKNIIKLKKGKYKVKVRAFVKSGKNKAYSKWTKTYSVRIK